MEDILVILIVFSVPLVSIVLYYISKVKRERNERDIRQLLIEHHADAETVKQMLAKPPKQTSPYSFTTLRWGAVLLGGGLGAVLAPDKHSLPTMVAIGAGSGLLLAFVLEFWMRRKLEHISKEQQTKE